MARAQREKLHSSLQYLRASWYVLAAVAAAAAAAAGGVVTMPDYKGTQFVPAHVRSEWRVVAATAISVLRSVSGSHD